MRSRRADGRVGGWRSGCRWSLGSLGSVRGIRFSQIWVRLVGPGVVLGSWAITWMGQGERIVDRRWVGRGSVGLGRDGWCFRLRGGCGGLVRAFRPGASTSGLEEVQGQFSGLVGPSSAIIQAPCWLIAFRSIFAPLRAASAVGAGSPSGNTFTEGSSITSDRTAGGTSAAFAAEVAHKSFALFRRWNSV